MDGMTSEQIQSAFKNASLKFAVSIKEIEQASVALGDAFKAYAVKFNLVHKRTSKAKKRTVLKRLK